jgi:RNA methyltransferase, TrmH family
MLVKSKIKYIQSLGQKKLRDNERVYIAEGPKIIDELLSSSVARIVSIYAVKNWIESHQSIIAKHEVIEVSEDELGKISQLTTPNQVLAIIQQFPPADITTQNAVCLVLDTIQDPGNLGTIIRIADWFGITQIVCSHECADIYNPKVVQSTMGSIARVKVLYTDLAEWLDQQEDIRVYGTALEGQDIRLAGKIHEGIIVIGNESKGISAEVMERVNVKITIPKTGKAESLNAAVATGIILSHIV